KTAGSGGHASPPPFPAAFAFVSADIRVAWYRRVGLIEQSKRIPSPDFKRPRSDASLESLSEPWHGSRAWGLRARGEARGGNRCRSIDDDEHRSMGPQSPCALRVGRGAGPPASFPLLGDVLHRLRRGASRSAPRRGQRGPCQGSGRLSVTRIDLVLTDDWELRGDGSGHMP